MAIATEAAATLATAGVGVRVVSMPCVEWFEDQDAAYRDSVLPPDVTIRVAVEAGATQGWWKYVGTQGAVVGIDHFGASADQATLFREFGITADRVVALVRSSLGNG